ncbi:MAG: CarD family transcriptional regulator [Myxococcota bacterium]|nr:CarD family transcriptional regulator [Myxococcota bacterium]
MEFKVGDRAVYPAHGVGVITSLHDEDLEGETYTVYTFKVLDNGMTITVPVQNADAIGMRHIIDPKSIDKIYDILRDRDTPTDNQTWNRRYREYMTKIRTGDPLEVAKVLRDLALMKMEKSLSFGERKMFDHARSLLVQEIAVSKDKEEDSIQKEIEGLFVAQPEAADKKKSKGRAKAKK